MAKKTKTTKTTKTSETYLATGRRKEAVARVRLTPGAGKIEVNKRPLATYFNNRITLTELVKKPLQVAGMADKFDIAVNVQGGGMSGQAGAVSLGITRALIKVDSELRPALKRAGLATRDPRMKERKKYGQRGARARFQWTKR